MRQTTGVLALLVLVPIGTGPDSRAAEPSDRARVIEHVVVYREPGRYGGWPANHGIWAWDDEILVGFSAGHMDRSMMTADGPKRHPIDRTRPEEHLLARSTDGGHTWKIERPRGLIPPPETGHMANVPTERGGKRAQAYPGAHDLTDPDFIMTFRMGDIHTGPSWFFTSADRGRAWQGPFSFPSLGLKGIAARTDYLVNDKQDMLAFLTAAKSNGREGRPFVARTTDGGRSWQFVSWIGPEPEEGFAIMPASVRLSGDSILVATRRQRESERRIDIYRSRDDGERWDFLATAVPDTGRGNPPSLLRLRDGRLALIYGYRAEPYSIRARLSTDQGRTWGSDIVLRDDAVDWDLGYVRSAQRTDGRIVSVYYHNDSRVQERYIAATIWDPGHTPSDD